MPAKKNEKKGLPVFGIVLVMLGIIMLLERYIPNLSFNFWALVLIVLGASLIIKHS